MDDHVARRSAAAGVALLAVVGAATGTGATLSWTAAAVAVAVALLLALRSFGAWPLVGLLSAVAVLVGVACDSFSADIGLFALCVVTGWALLRLPAWPGVVVPAVSLVVIGVSAVGHPDPGWIAWTAGTLFTGAACWSARRERALLEQLREAQAGLADRARVDERARIAHELHDVIGHALTVSLLHVTSARLALDEDPAEAAASLAEAERLAQQSLAEVRAVVGLMRDAAGSAPLPGADQLDELVASFRRAGADVDWQVVGDVAGLTAIEGLTVYRIVQEALTNAVRHAPGAAVSALLEVAPGRTRVVVDTPAPAREPVGAGAGLVGMRERAEALGGRLTAGPPADGVPGAPGWRVEAVLP
ncbi:histidine kinase [Nocardioides marinquilinus]|uniref:histidine kinase n=1 Tax=Nocardioides marinquilinus TaxID=1210400 RepID=A0ABP9PQL0_9ACTN